MKPSKKAAKATAKPLTITITGKLADDIRAAAKAMGVRPATLVSIDLPLGMVLTEATPAGDEFRLASAARYVGLSLESTAELHRYAKAREKAEIEARRARRGAKRAA